MKKLLVGDKLKCKGKYVNYMIISYLLMNYWDKTKLDKFMYRLNNIL